MRKDKALKGGTRICSKLNRRELLRTSAATAMAGVASSLLKPVHASERSREYGGYTNQLSYQAGDEITFHISTPAQRYDLEIARIGGQREVVWLDIQGYQHPTSENASTHGCKWPVSLRLEVPETWRSGYYRVRLRGLDARGTEVTDSMFFVVRSSRPGGTAKILLQLATNTYNAYNNWGGSSLYGGRPTGQARFV